LRRFRKRSAEQFNEVYRIYGLGELNIIAGPRCGRCRIPLGIGRPFQSASRFAVLSSGLASRFGATQCRKNGMSRSVKIKIAWQYRARSGTARALLFSGKTIEKQTVKGTFLLRMEGRLAREGHGGPDRNLYSRPEKATTFAEPRCPTVRPSPSGPHLFDTTRGPRALEGATATHGSSQATVNPNESPPAHL
jgi:hypothetical protein